jgi:hypothetical protein
VPMDKQKINEFTLNLQVKRLGDPTAPGAPGKAPGAPAAKGGKA